MGQSTSLHTTESSTNNGNGTTTQLNQATTTEKGGTDRTYHVNDLLRHVDTEQADSIQFDEESDVTREELVNVPGAFVLFNVCSSNECQQLIALSEQLGYSPAPLSILSGSFQNSEINDYTRQLRDSSRVLCDIPKSMLDVIQNRIVDHLPPTVTYQNEEWRLKRQEALNGRWRFNKYSKGQKFGPHFDAGYTRNANEKTLLTFILYLNGEDLDGGETVFFPGNKRNYFDTSGTAVETKVNCQTGKALVFYQAGEQNWRHEGAPHQTENSYKYIIRSDIMYERANPILLDCQ